MATQVIGRCWSCGNELTAADYGRENRCLKCDKATRVCRNCRWFDPARANQCSEPMAEPVQDKTRANYCGFFEPTADLEAQGVTSATDLKRAAEDLFK